MALLLCVFMSAQALADVDSSGLQGNYEEQRRAMARKLEAATLMVLCIDDGSISSGSGFVVADGYIITNAHVVDDASRRAKFYVFNDTLEPTEVKVMAKAYQQREASGNDFAILKYTSPAGINLPTLAFNTDVQRMDKVSAWGYPAIVTQFDQSMQDFHRSGLKNFTPPPVVYTEGTVSTLVRDKGGSSIIHTAPIAGGNSGGPLVNSRGEVVGINTWGYSDRERGSVIFASLTGSDIITFMRKHKVEPTMAEKPRPQAPPAAADGSSQARPAGDSLAHEADSRITDAKALATLDKARKGDAHTMVQVGVMYLDGNKGYPKDMDKALYWLDKASAANDPKAQGILGMLFVLDDQVHNPSRGLRLLRQSANSADAGPDIQAFLAAVLYEGEHLGIATDYEESYSWAQKSATAGNAAGNGILAFHYYDGVTTKIDDARALSLATEAAKAGDPRGKALVAVFQHQGNEFKNNPKAVLKLAEEAANAGEAAAQGMLARIYAFDSNYKDVARAERWGRLAAGQANPEGQYVLGWLYMNGFVVEKNNIMAWAYLNLADDKIDDLKVDSRGPLLALVDKQMSSKDKEDAKQLQKNWFSDWGLKGVK